MFVKTFKKTISLFMALVFILSLVPTVGMAEESTTNDVELDKAAFSATRDGNSTQSYQTKNYSTTTFRARSTTNNHSNAYHSYVKFDFTGKEKEFLAADSAALCVTGTIRNDGMSFVVTVLSCGNDDWVPSELSANMTRELGMIADEGTFSTTYTSEVKALDANISSEALLNGIKQALINDPDDSVVVVRFDSADGADVYMTSFSIKLKYTYDREKLPSDEEYVNSLKSKLTWDVLSNEDKGLVTSDISFPTKVLGAYVTWTSNNESAINPLSGEVAVNSAADTFVTITANIKYNDTYATPLTYSVRIPCNPIIIEDACDGSSNLPVGGTSGDNYQKIYIHNDGLSGKDINDKYYKVCDSGGNPYINIPTASGYQDVAEMSIMLTEECKQISISMSLFNNANYPNDSDYRNEFATQFYFRKDGFYRRDKLITELELNKWYNIAFVCPTGQIGSDADGNAIYDQTLEIYVNGIMMPEVDLGFDCVGGISFFRINGIMDSLDPETPAGYLDNLRIHNDPYVPEYDMEADISMTEYGLDVLGETITVTGTTTVADVKNDIGESFDYKVRVYDVNGALAADSDVVSDGYTVVIAATNGTNMERAYSYYTIRVVDGKIAFDTPYIAINEGNGEITGNVKVYNYTGENESYQLYLAVYNEDDSLKEIHPFTLEATAGRATALPAETFRAILGAKETAKLFIWDAEDGITPVLLSVES